MGFLIFPVWPGPSTGHGGIRRGQVARPGVAEPSNGLYGLVMVGGWVVVIGGGGGRMSGYVWIRIITNPLKDSEGGCYRVKLRGELACPSCLRAAENEPVIKAASPIYQSGCTGV